VPWPRPAPPPNPPPRLPPPTPPPRPPRPPNPPPPPPPPPPGRRPDPDPPFGSPLTLSGIFELSSLLKCHCPARRAGEAEAVVAPAVGALPPPSCAATLPRNVATARAAAKAVHL